MSSLLFYNSDTEFDDDILIDEDENVEFVNISKKDKVADKQQEPGEIDIIDEIDSNEIEYVDDTSEEMRDFISKVKITRVVNSEFIDYTDDQFKNNILLLTRDNIDGTNAITNVNNLLSIYNNLKNKKDEKINDKLFYPIVSIKKKMFLIETEKYTDGALYNNSPSLIKNTVEDYLQKSNNVNNSGEPYDIKQNRLYELERPFDTLNDSESNNYKYVAEFNRDVITDCIHENIGNYNGEDFKCVDILNNPRKLDKFRLLSKKTYKMNDDEIKQLYSGDQVRIVGYVNKIPDNDNVSLFDLEQYMEDINDMKVDDEIFIILTINNDNNKYSGKIQLLQDNKIIINLDKKIQYIDDKVDTLIYDKDNVNYFTLYRKNEKKNIYQKTLLFKDDSPVITFKFPEVFTNEEYNKFLMIIFPNLKELLLNNNEFINYNDLNEILDKYNFDINNLDKKDIENINIKLNKNIKDFNKDYIDDLKIKKKQDKKYEFKTTNPLLNNFPEHYINYTEANTFKDSSINRLIHLSKQNDKGFYHFITELKKTLEKDLESIKDIDLEKELKLFETEYNKLQLEKKKFKPDDCKQIKIDKLYYTLEALQKDEGNKKDYEGKYVVLNDGNNFITIYQMTNGNWVKQFNLQQSERDNIKFCDGAYYYKKLDKNICMYDDITSLCKKRDEFINKQNLNKLSVQIDIIKELQDFKNNFKKYNKYLDTLLNNYKNKTYNFYDVKQITHSKKISNKKYVGDENFIDFDTIYNNFEVVNDPFYIPIDEENTTDNKLDDKINDYQKLVNKILQVIGFQMNDSEIRHIIKSIDNINQKILEKKISEAKSENKEYKNLSDKDIISKLYNNIAEQRTDIHRNIVLIIASMLIIIIQIQYPNVKLLKINSKCSKFFSLVGYPIDKASKENMKKQLYVYVGCCLFTGMKEELSDLSNNLVLNKIQQIIRIILKERPYYITLLKKNKRIYQEVNDSDFKIKVWPGYKPELKIKKEPTTTVGKYLYKISQNIRKDKVYKYDYLKKPLINNICCYEKIDKNLNYYTYFDNKFNEKENLIRSIKNSDNNIGIEINETFFNLIKNEGFKYNFDSEHIFNIEDEMKFDNLDLYESEKFDKSKYYDYSNVFMNLFNEQNINNENITKILENFNDTKQWDKLSMDIDSLFTKLMDFTKSYAINFDDNVINDLKLYLVTLRNANGNFDISNLLNIKNISQKWISYKTSYLLSKIINHNDINHMNAPIMKNVISENDKMKISNIIDNNNKDLVGFNDSITDNDTIKTNFNNKSKLFVVDSYKINLNDNTKENKSVDNITKNVYLLNYIFITIIYNIYTLILSNDEELNINSILDRINVFISSEEIDENKVSQLTLIANIISYILKEYRDDIKINLIDNDELQSKVNSLREDKKQRQIRYFENLTLDDVDAHKLLKEIGHRIDINEDYTEDKDVQELIVENPDTQQDIIFGEEVGDNDMLTDPDYLGENPDEEDQDYI